MNPFERHDLLVVSGECRERLCRVMQSSGEPHCAQMAATFAAADIPVIVRRHSPCDQNAIGIGISFPIRVVDQRLRFAAAVELAEVERMISPYTLVEGSIDSSVAPLHVLKTIRDLGLVRSGHLGVYGSSALQLATGLEYVDDDSDLDLIVKAEPIDVLRRAHDVLTELERSSGVGIDVEVMLEGGRAVKLKELFSEQKSVLTKSIVTVDVIRKVAAMQSLPGLSGGDAPLGF